jgi:hypothetical protein
VSHHDSIIRSPKELAEKLRRRAAGLFWDEAAFVIDRDYWDTLNAYEACKAMGRSFSVVNAVSLPDWLWM